MRFSGARFWADQRDLRKGGGHSVCLINVNSLFVKMFPQLYKNN